MESVSFLRPYDTFGGFTEVIGAGKLGYDCCCNLISYLNVVDCYLASAFFYLKSSFASGLPNYNWLRLVFGFKLFLLWDAMVR